MTDSSASLYPDQPDAQAETLTKRCSTCGDKRPLDCFYPQKTGRLGRAACCIDCGNKKRRKGPRIFKNRSYVDLLDNITRKVCADCGYPKPIDEFSLNSQRYDGRMSTCKPCTSAYVQEKISRFIVEVENLESTKICSKCGGDLQPIANFTRQRHSRTGRNNLCITCLNKQKDCTKKKRDEYLAENEELRLLDARKTFERARNIRLSRFGVDQEWYDKTLDKQGRKCDICGTTNPGEGKMFAVDHDHRCCPEKTACDKCRRGLLCFRCNLNLTYIESQWRALAVAYLNKHKLKDVTSSDQPSLFDGL